jgi:hypothetical protein
VPERALPERAQFDRRHMTAVHAQVRAVDEIRERAREKRDPGCHLIRAIHAPERVLHSSGMGWYGAPSTPRCRRVEYELTTWGQSLAPILNAICEWGERYKRRLDARTKAG